MHFSTVIYQTFEFIIKSDSLTVIKVFDRKCEIFYSEMSYALTSVRKMLRGFMYSTMLLSKISNKDQIIPCDWTYNWTDKRKKKTRLIAAKESLHLFVSLERLYQFFQFIFFQFRLEIFVLFIWTFFSWFFIHSHIKLIDIWILNIV